jgi:hypothetical protein
MAEILKPLPSSVFKVFKMTVIRGLFEKFVDWRQCAAVMQREA